MKLHPLVAQLVEARLARGLSQRRVARLAGLNQKTMQRMEAGTRDPHLPTLDVLADFYGAEVTLKWPGKRCSVCDEDVPPRFFGVDLRYADGRAPYCLACKAEGAVPAVQAGCGMANVHRIAARNEREKTYFGWRDAGLDEKQVAVRLREEFNLGDRTAMRYEQRYQDQLQRQQEAA